MNFKQWLNKNEDDIDTYNYPTESMELAFNAGREQYKSIVKTVDPENLPKGEVLAFNFKGISFLGYLEKENDFASTIVRSNYSCMYNVTKYIEQKDLIKLFEA